MLSVLRRCLIHPPLPFLCDFIVVFSALRWYGSRHYQPVPAVALSLASPDLTSPHLATLTPFHSLSPYTATAGLDECGTLTLPLIIPCHPSSSDYPSHPSRFTSSSFFLLYSVSEPPSAATCVCTPTEGTP